MADLLRGSIAINEILVDPNGATAFDTDGNGTSAATDEFFELVNISNTTISIAGLQLWDRGVGQWFTFPPGANLAPGGRAVVVTGVQAGGSLPAVAAGSLAFDAGRGSAVITNTGDNVMVYDPTANQFIIARFNGVAQDNPTTGVAGYSGFSSTATQSGAGKNFGNDVDGLSIQRSPDGSTIFVNATPTPGTANLGTRVMTPKGAVQVQDLRAGDLVMTRDRGAQPLIWVWSKTQSVAAMANNAQLRPMCIARHALGAGLPLRDLHLSQQHRVLVASPIAARIFDAGEVLIAAKWLCDLPGVAVVLPARDITYVHVMLARHEVPIAEGTPSESLFLGRQALQSMDGAALTELCMILGADTTALPHTQHAPARLFATGRDARALVARHAKHQKPLVAARVSA
ncbi:Hint domain-containing protein [Pseudorhodobacter antarcticus]|uniref:Hint domain-containing protein n=1 Tax=Pseudorhodobacter antarcticus TaxID=1077947 RepID=UPI0015878045|nr:Hint domain-containing protein [Pseudorhodobacter antarcticus]